MVICVYLIYIIPICGEVLIQHHGVFFRKGHCGSPRATGERSTQCPGLSWPKLIMETMKLHEVLENARCETCTYDSCVESHVDTHKINSFILDSQFTMNYCMMLFFIELILSPD